jgi:hypothetical protein
MTSTACVANAPTCSNTTRWSLSVRLSPCLPTGTFKPDETGFYQPLYMRACKGYLVRASVGGHGRPSRVRRFKE